MSKRRPIYCGSEWAEGVRWQTFHSVRGLVHWLKENAASIYRVWFL